MSIMDAMRLLHLHSLGRQVPLPLLQVELPPARAQDLRVAAPAVLQQLRRCDGCEVRSLPIFGPPEGARFGLAQVAMVLGRRHLDRAAHRQRRNHFHQQLLDDVVVDLLDDGPDTLGRLGCGPNRFDDLQNVGRTNRTQPLGSDSRPYETLETRLDLLPIGIRLGHQPFRDPALGERLELVGRRHSVGGPFAFARSTPGDVHQPDRCPASAELSVRSGTHERPRRRPRDSGRS